MVCTAYGSRALFVEVGSGDRASRSSCLKNAFDDKERAAL
jgi:hypothetical protein